VTRDGIENAIIESTNLGNGERAIMTATLHFSGDGWGQSFGDYGLDSYDKDARTRRPSAYCGFFIAGILRAVGVGSWEELKGKHCRIRRENGLIRAVGHIIKDEWFGDADMKGFAATIERGES